LYGKSLTAYGDISTISFHATKLFHTVEGGAILTNDDSLAHKVSYMRNFGHNGQEEYWGLGINGKTSELYAAMGLCMLPEMPSIMTGRKEICKLYDALLRESNLELPCGDTTDFKFNYAYYPVLFETETQLLEAKTTMNANNIFPRRYFYPALNLLDYTADERMPVAESVAKRVMCLPLYHDLGKQDVEAISRLCKTGFEIPT
jgi:dTDP-4-amino-4,6-dideoxygalactose transaminase